MGHGIALVFGLHGFRVALVDLAIHRLETAMTTISKNLDRLVKKGQISSEEKVGALVHISTSTSLAQSVKDTDFVIEAATEDLSLKLKIFQDLSRYCPTESILASNTSSISITKLASVVDQPERVIGMHFMNPVPIMPLVEVIRAYQTSDQVTEVIMTLCQTIKKTPVEVNDYPGFVANRILMPMINEAIYTRYEGVAEVEDIDAIMKLGMAHPMGPLQLADFIGLDVCLSILNVLYKGFGNPKFAPCPLLVNMVHAGRLGKKSGEGFYCYESGKPPVVAPGF